MSLTGISENNSIGGFGFGGGNGITPVINLGNVFDRGRRDCDDNSCSDKLHLMKAIDDVKEDNRGNAIALGASIDRFKDNATEKFFDLSKDICDTRHDIQKELCDSKTSLLGAITDTRVDILKSAYETDKSITALSVKTDSQFAELEREGAKNTAIILAELKNSEIERLRDELHHSHRRFDSREIEINNINTNTNVLSAIQTIKSDSDRKFDVLFSQVAKTNQDIINVGGILTGVSQTSNPVNVK